MEKELGFARDFALAWHGAQVDKAGVPYFRHLDYVASSVSNTKAKIVAYLHDVLEDTACTKEILEESGFSKEVIDAVVSITHQTDEPYSTFINRVSNNYLATLVKLEDMKHNADLSRLDKITQKDIDRSKKYRFYISMLSAQFSEPKN